MVTAYQLVQQAKTGKYIGIPYEKLDCQAFVEQVLKDCGEKHNWRGSNHIWRDAVHVRKHIENIEEIPAGALVFTVKDDGGEKSKGYYDGLKNAKHVGLYLGGGEVVHSTRNNSSNGVQMDSITSSRWTDYALLKCVEYTPIDSKLTDIFQYLKQQTLYDLYVACKKIWG